MISIFIGILLFFTKIHLPEIINDSISSVGNMIGPASMIVTGMLFAGMDLKQILIKLSHLAAFSADGDKIMLIVFLAIITPSASTVTQMCQVYENDSQYASAINVVTTLFSIVTMPLLVMLFQMF